jgi:hypothetical protein
MKLKEFLEVALLGKTDGSPDHLYGEELNKYKDIIKGCDEFVKCDSLEILNFPAVIGKNGKTYNVNTVKLSDLMGFKGVMVRGLFEVIENYDGSEPIRNTYDIDLTKSKTIYGDENELRK